MTRILFVCLGNICRSPTAEAVMRARAEAAGQADSLTLDSAGTGDWHVGKPPDRRARDAAAKRGYDLSSLRARQVNRDDFHTFDFILAMDGSNLADLQALAPAGSRARVQLFLDFSHGPEQDVPDPYYGGEDGFDAVLDLVESACDGLIATLGGRPGDA